MASRWLTLFLLLSPALAAENNFGFYPKGAQSCLYQAADDADCTGKDSKELNYCLCGQGSYKNDFILGSARCVGEESPGDVDETFDTMQQACKDSSTPLKVTKEEFQEAAKEGETTTTADSATTTTTKSKQTADYTTTSGGRTVTVIATSDNSNEDNTTSKDDDSGLSTGATIGIGVGAALAGAALIAGAVFLLLRRRRKRNAEESHPMLPNYDGNNAYNASTYPPSEPKPAWSTANAPNQQGWNHPYAGAYAPPKPPQDVANQNLVYEMDGSVVNPAIEMPGSTPHGGR
ncbi:hypothetical protein ACHAPT_009226 [Fusarium lateritium]